MEDYGKTKKLHDSLQRKEFSCGELTKTYIGAIEVDSPTLNAYVHFTPKIALTATQEADAKTTRGEMLDILEEAPMTLKGNIFTTGIETTCGSKTLEGYRLILDATAWGLPRSRGAVLPGKTNMDEFAMGSSSETSIYGSAWNPHNIAHVTGDSSDGVASAVAGNLAIYSLDTDIGGSIRQPASFCGIVGLKPTYDTVPRYGMVTYASSFDRVGPVATNVEDTVLVYDALTKQDPEDPASRGARELAYDTPKEDIKGMWIGPAKQYFDGVHDEVCETAERSMQAYRELGAKLVKVDLPQPSYALPVYHILSYAEASSNPGRSDDIRYGYKAKNYGDVSEMIARTRGRDSSREVKRRILFGAYVLSAGYYDAYCKKAQSLRGTLVQAFQSAFGRCDVTAASTAPMTFSEHGKSTQNTVGTYLTNICTVPINIAGIPALSLPCGFGQKGLPTGLQLIGNSSHEATLLSAAYRFEQATRETVFRAAKMGARQ